jgi:hypothetical protein
MPYIIVDNFKAGLDQRRNALTSEPGTLVQCLNAAITSGGELEKRRGFELKNAIEQSVYLSASHPSPFDTVIGTTFGLLSTDTTLYIFGSADQTAEQLAAWTAAGLTYQQLKHPAMLQASPPTYDANKHLMVALTAQTVINNKPWVAAKYADGKTFCFYDGALIRAFRDGLILDGLTDTEDVAEHIKDMFGRVPGLTAVRSGSNVNIKGVAGQNVSFTLEEDSTHGILGSEQVSAGTPGTPATSAVGTFKISHGATASSGLIANVKVDSVAIMNPATPIAWQTTAAATATAVANAINAYKTATIDTDYTADSNGNTVFLYGPAASAASYNAKAVEVTVSGGMVVGGVAFNIQEATAGDTVTSIKVAGVELLSGTVTCATDRIAYAEQIAAAIRAAGTAYTAVANSEIFYICKKVQNAAVTGLSTVVTYTGGLIIEESLTGTPDPTPLRLAIANGTSTSSRIVYYMTEASVVGASYNMTNNVGLRLPSTLGLSITGGTPPYRGNLYFADGNEKQRDMLVYDTNSLWSDPVIKYVPIFDTDHLDTRQFIWKSVFESTGFPSKWRLTVKDSQNVTESIFFYVLLKDIATYGV